jgi:hypothetical protein
MAAWAHMETSVPLGMKKRARAAQRWSVAGTMKTDSQTADLEQARLQFRGVESG